MRHNDTLLMTAELIDVGRLKMDLAIQQLIRTDRDTSICSAHFDAMPDQQLGTIKDHTVHAC